MRFSELDGRTVALWGVGRETRSLARQLSDRLPAARLACIVTDNPERDRAAAADDPLLAGLPLLGPDDALGGVDVLVRSPGVSIHKPPLIALRARGVVVTTATGLWLHEREGRNVIGVTGTKGKGTTCVLIHHLLPGSHLAGNIGRSVIDLLDVPVGERVVLELSSFQISDLLCGPEVCVLTNLFSEHLDWHGDEATYRAEKLRLFGLPGVHACAYRPGDSEVAAAVAPGARRVLYGAAPGWRVEDDAVRGPGGAAVPLEAIPLHGLHNAENLCAALAALEAAGIPVPPLPDALAGVKGLPHRLESVIVEDGIEWVDDSIATNPVATEAALAAFDGRPVVLIAGGYERGQDLSGLALAAASREPVTLVCLPDTGGRLARAAIAAGMDAARISHAADMADAVAQARVLARPGGVVVLSPAAPSYNAYRDFEQRGAHFAALARAVARSRA